MFIPRKSRAFLGTCSVGTLNRNKKEFFVQENQVNALGLNPLSGYYQATSRPPYVSMAYFIDNNIITINKDGKISSSAVSNFLTKGFTITEGKKSREDNRKNSLHNIRKDENYTK